jgi:solute carrier family 25 phosphate transporter 23/24/25/41
MQTKNQAYPQTGVYKMLHYIFKNEGTFGLWKGNWANCLRIAPFTAVEFYCFEVYKEMSKALLKKFDINMPDTLRYLLCGSLSGITAYSVVYPIDLAKTLLASSKDPSMTIYKTISGVYKTRG